MYGIYLLCDHCKTTTIGGEQVTSNPEPALSRHQGAELRKRAGDKGWLCVVDSSYGVEPVHADVCPGCSVNRILTPVQ